MKGYFKILWMRQVVSVQFVCLSWFPTSTRASKCRLYCSKQQDRDMSICLLDEVHKCQETYKKAPSFDHWFVWYPPLTLNWLSTGTGWALLHRLYIVTGSYTCRAYPNMATRISNDVFNLLANRGPTRFLVYGATRVCWFQHLVSLVPIKKELHCKDNPFRAMELLNCRNLLSLWKVK